MIGCGSQLRRTKESRERLWTSVHFGRDVVEFAFDHESGDVE